MGLAGCINAVAAPLGWLVGVNADKEELLLLLIKLPLDELFIKLDDEDEALLDVPVNWLFKDNIPPATNVPALQAATLLWPNPALPKLSRSLLKFDSKPAIEPLAMPVLPAPGAAVPL